MSENKYPIGGYVPVNAENELMYRIIENWGNAVAMPQMEGWIKEYGDKRAEEAKPAGAVWVKASERLPEVVDGKCHPRFVRIERVGHSGNGYAIKAVAYYFPEHFKSVEWEDWDDYNEEDFPYTESDEQRGVVWLKPGWYADIECDACDNSHWSAPLNVIEWLDESSTAANKEGETDHLIRQHAIAFMNWTLSGECDTYNCTDEDQWTNIYTQEVISTEQLHQLWQQSKSK